MQGLLPHEVVSLELESIDAKVATERMRGSERRSRRGLPMTLICGTGEFGSTTTLGKLPNDVYHANALIERKQALGAQRDRRQGWSNARRILKARVITVAGLVGGGSEHPASFNPESRLVPG